MYDPSLHTKGMLRSVFFLLDFEVMIRVFKYITIKYTVFKRIILHLNSYIVAEMKAGVTAINCIKNTSFRAILRLFGRAARHASAGSVERSCTNKTACYESRSARVWRRYRTLYRAVPLNCGAGEFHLFFSTTPISNSN